LISIKLLDAPKSIAGVRGNGNALADRVERVRASPTLNSLKDSLKEDQALPDQKAEVIRYYDTHPINEDEILAKLTAAGVDLDRLSEDQLKDYDQDHYGGTDVVDLLAQCARIRREHHVLDVCSGMGGPARWIAHRVGCRVTGMDFTLSRVEAARRLTARVKLQHLVDFVHGDATAMPFISDSYDVVMSQEAWLHIPDKAAVIGEAVRVAKPGGVIAFTDAVSRNPLTPEETSRLGAEMHAPGMAAAAQYLDLLRGGDCTIEICEDLSSQ
jgi:sarcosine/dimethylglycine N-methyltransferase